MLRRHVARTFEHDHPPRCGEAFEELRRVRFCAPIDAGCASDTSHDVKSSARCRLGAVVINVRNPLAQVTNAGPRRMVVLEGASHMPTEHPGVDQLEAAVIAFLRELPTSRVIFDADGGAAQSATRR